MDFKSSNFISFLDSNFVETLFLTFKLASITTAILLPLGILIALYLAGKKSIAKNIIEALTFMPLTLPPTVLGFYILVSFSPNSFIGGILKDFDIQIAFSFSGLVLASVIFSLPFMVNPIKTGLQQLGSHYKEVSYTFGKSRFYTIIFVLLPNIKPSLMLGIITSFAHTLGEFGVVAMIGGDRQGETKVASIALFTEWESGNFASANSYALILSILSFLLLFFMIILNKKLEK